MGWGSKSDIRFAPPLIEYFSVRYPGRSFRPAERGLGKNAPITRRISSWLIHVDSVGVGGAIGCLGDVDTCSFMVFDKV